MARPRKKIDPALVEKLAAAGCPTRTIAFVCDCSHDTLQRRFASLLEKGKAGGNARLLVKQFDLAMTGNVSMLIWLGKQRLEQRDRSDHTGKDGGPIEHVIRVIRETKAANADD